MHLLVAKKRDLKVFILIFLIHAIEACIKKIRAPIFLLFSFLIGTPVYASSASSIDYDNDLAIGLLGKIFGPLINIQGKVAPETVFSEQIVYFVPIASMIALTISGIMIYFKAFSTANQGKLFDSAKASSAMHLRVVAALGFLIPDKYGFPVIQKVFIWFIIQGIGVANVLWMQIVENYQTGHLLNNEGKVETAVSGVTEPELDNFIRVLIQACLKAQYQKQYLGLSSIAFSAGENDFRLESVPTLSNQSLGPWVFDLAPLTGGPQNEDKERDLKTYQQTQSFLLSFANDLLGDPVIESLSQNLYYNKDLDEDMTGLPYDKVLLKSWYEGRKDSLKNSLIRAKADPDSSEEKLFAGMQNGGWFLAGSFYWKFQSLEDPGQPVGEEVDLVSESSLLTATTGKDIEETNRIRKVNDFLKDITSTPGVAAKKVQRVEDDSGGLDFSFKGVFDENASDHLLTFTVYCQNKIVSIINFLQNLTVGSIAAAFILFMITPGYSSNASIAIFLGFNIFFVATSLLALVFAPLVMGSLYIPFLPFLIFFVATVAWVIKVIEAILAAPIVAVALVEPSEDDFGRVAQAGVMLLNVSFRPLLMVIGFVFASRLVNIALIFVGSSLLSFESAFAVASDFNVLGVMLWELARLGVIVTLVQVLVSRCFSLIYVIPDKVFSWIGLRADHSDSRALVQDIHEGMQEGIKNVEGIFKFTNVIQQSLDNYRKK